MLGAASPTSQTRLQQEVESLIHQGAIVRNRRDELCLRERLQLVVGTVSGHRDGYGILHPDDRSAPLILPYRQMREVMHGDRVAARVSGKDHRGRIEGAVVEVLPLPGLC